MTKSMLELQVNECRWPIGDEDVVFCAEPTDGKVYCDHHHERSVAPYGSRWGTVEDVK